MVVVHGVTDEQTLHVRRQALRTASQQDIRIMAHEGPTADGRARPSGHLPQAAYERLATPLIIHHLARLLSLHHDMVQDAWTIEKGLSGHGTKPRLH
jgi:hypothetical protein